MTTATEYRQYAQECMQSAREAQSDPVRKQFLDLAKLWMTAAERIDAQSALPKPISKLDGHAPPRSAVSPHDAT
jgi:hypothetical protein